VLQYPESGDPLNTAFLTAGETSTFNVCVDGGPPFKAYMCVCVCVCVCVFV
jgi:hypothetical protein